MLFHILLAPEGPSPGWIHSHLPKPLSTFESPGRIFSSPTIRSSVLSGGDAVRSVGLTTTPHSSKQRWPGPWPLLSSSVLLLLSLILASPWFQSMTHGRKGEGASFSSTTSNWPLRLAPPMRTREREWELGAGEGDREGHRLELELQGLLGLLPSTLESSQHPLSPSPFGGEAHYCSLYSSALLQSMCLTTQHTQG